MKLIKFFPFLMALFQSSIIFSAAFQSIIGSLAR